MWPCRGFLLAAAAAPGSPFYPSCPLEDELAGCEELCCGKECIERQVALHTSAIGQSHGREGDVLVCRLACGLITLLSACHVISYAVPAPGVMATSALYPHNDTSPPPLALAACKQGYIGGICMCVGLYG